MILTAHQPAYLPWCGLLHKIALADAFVVFDGVQYERKGFSNRNTIKTRSGPLMLSVPVESKGHFEKRLCDVKIVPGPWARKHLRSIGLAYQHAPYFERYFDSLSCILCKQWESLAGLNRALLDWFLKQFEIKVPIVTASEQDFRGQKSELVLDMCCKMGVKTYIFGAQGRGYADVAAFEAAGVRAVFQEYRQAEYPQLHGTFVPNLSALDLLMNCGLDSRQILMRGNVSRETLVEAT